MTYSNFKIITILIVIITISMIYLGCTTSIDRNQIPEPEFDEKIHSPNSLIIVFDHETVGVFNFGYVAEKNENGQIQIGHDSFDKMAERYNIIGIFQLDLFDDMYVRDTEWPGYSRLNVFRITFNNALEAKELYTVLIADKSILKAWYDFKDIPKKDIPAYAQSILVICFDNEKTGFMDIGFEADVNEDGFVQIGYSSFDELSIRYGFTEIIQVYYYNRDTIPNFGNLARNVFAIIMECESVIHDALFDLRNEDIILSIDYGFIDSSWYSW